jgi:hypothetical protein
VITSFDSGSGVKRQTGPQQTKPHVLLAVAGGVAILGAFLPWVSAQAFIVHISRSGLDQGDGWLTLIAGAAMIAVACRGLRPDRSPLGVLLWVGLPALAVVGVGGYDTAHFLVKMQDLPAGASASIGAGLWLTDLAGVAGVALAMAAAAARRDEIHPNVVNFDSAA